VQDRWTIQDGLNPGNRVITLGACFLNGTESEKETVRNAAVVWTSPGALGGRLQFAFDVPQRKSQIRVQFHTGEGNNSSIGHAICPHHEQQFPDNNPIKWKEDVVIAYCWEHYKWDEKKTRANILNKLPTSYKCIGDPAFNPESIMIYRIPPEWTEDHVSWGEGKGISQGDVRCVRAIYDY
jgi:hypothetical protein